MGVVYLFANPSKRQYIVPDAFGEGDRFRHLLRKTDDRGTLHTAALCLLTCKVPGSDPAYFPEFPWAAWHGDPVYAAGDGDGINTYDLTTATSDQPHRNLYDLAVDEYEDISYAAVAMLCRWDSTAAGILAARVADQLRWVDSPDSRGLFSPTLLIDIGRAADHYDTLDLHPPGGSPIGRELTTLLGAAWRDRYETERRRFEEKIGEELGPYTAGSY